ncbi:MAG TPA: hypothetical protein PK280_02645 [Planctomycetota bacterium]|nr:hypothetical protein [Planctomycetota bacterium]
MIGKGTTMMANLRCVAVLLGSLLGLATCLAPAAVAGESQPGPVPVLDLDSGSFNLYMRWKTPALVDKDGKAKTLLGPLLQGMQESERKPWPAVAAALPPANWTGPDFEESAWPRVRGRVMVGQDWGGGGLGGVHGYSGIYFPGTAAEWSLMCLRGKFTVTDPGQVKDLKLVLRYHGGAVVYVNGAELARSHLPEGKIDLETLAERYAEDAYVRADGKLYNPHEADNPEVTRVRVRQLAAKGSADGVVIPAAMLKKGVNVIAVELHAAPINEVDLTGKTGGYKGLSERGKATCWPHVAIIESRVTAAAGAGLVPCVGPSPAVELWNSQQIETTEAWDFARPSEAVQPIRMVGARNGVFSGKVVLGSAETIRGIKAGMSDLAAADGKGKIPAAAAQVRLAEIARPETSWNKDSRHDRLLEVFPAEVQPASVSVKVRYSWAKAKAFAVAPVWVTVRVPADAAPGLYKGTLSVEAAGAAGPAKFSVPVELKVIDWRVPDPRDFDVQNNMYQSADTLAQYYKVPLWGDKHMELIGRSLEVFAQAGSRICVLNLTCKSPSLNNVDSMVVWVKKEGGGYTYDFTAVDKYMEVFAKKVGKPSILLLNIWSHPGMDPKKPYPPLAVTVRDPATGRTEAMPQPAYGTPENEAFWKPVLTELRGKIEKRGWLDATAVCNISYCRGPAKDVVDVFQHIWPDGRWMNSSHSNPESYPASQGSMPVPYSEWVWGAGRPYNPETDKGGKFQYAFYPRPWKLGAGRIEVANPRYGNAIVERMADWSPLVLYRTVDEAAVQSNVRGTGRIGGDFWPLPGGKDGRYVHLCDSYEAVGPENNTCSMTAPGPDGALWTERLEMFREGAQIAEAITFLTKALDARKVSGDLEKRIVEALDERARYYLRARWPFGPRYEFGGDAYLSFISSNWQARDELLFSLAAEVARK